LKISVLASTMAACRSLEHAASRTALDISIHEHQRWKMSMGRLLQPWLIRMLHGSGLAMVEFGRWGFFRLDLRGRRLPVLERLASRIVVLGEASEASEARGYAGAL
jgi:hypothetical protein